MNNFIFDKEFAKDKYIIAGIDEVGRGCLFGDVVSACVIMPLDKPIEGIKDSKKLSEKKRKALYTEILNNAIAIGIGRVDAKTIDEINIKQASRLAMKRAVENTKSKDMKLTKADLYLIDAENIDLDIKQESIVHGDDTSYSIACASIVAKVYRDKLCLDWEQKYPGYYISKNKGYGTKAHRDAILMNGATLLHRNSFLKKILTT